MKVPSGEKINIAAWAFHKDNDDPISLGYGRTYAEPVYCMECSVTKRNEKLNFSQAYDHARLVHGEREVLDSDKLKNLENLADRYKNWMSRRKGN